MEKHIKHFSMSLVISLGMASAIQGSTVVPLSFRDLSGKAHRITIGRINSIISHRDGDSSRIVSKINITETHSVTGAPPATFTFEMVGGTVDGIRQSIAGFPSFEVGDRVALFLAEETGTPLGPTLGLWQGVFFVQTDANGVDIVTDHARRPLAEIRGDELIIAQPAKSGPVLAAAPGVGVTLDAFLSRVRTLRESSRAGSNR